MLIRLTLVCVAAFGGTAFTVNALDPEAKHRFVEQLQLAQAERRAPEAPPPPTPEQFLAQLSAGDMTDHAQAADMAALMQAMLANVDPAALHPSGADMTPEAFFELLQGTDPATLQSAMGLTEQMGIMLATLGNGPQPAPVAQPQNPVRMVGGAKFMKPGAGMRPGAIRPAKTMPPGAIDLMAPSRGAPSSNGLSLSDLQARIRAGQGGFVTQRNGSASLPQHNDVPRMDGMILQ